MKKKIIGVIIAIALIMTFALSYIISYAKTDEIIYVNLEKLDTNGVGYGIWNPTNGVNVPGQPVQSAYIWNVTTYDTETSTTASVNQRNLYCIKANYGDTWEDATKGPDTIIPYNLSYDLERDRAKLLEKLPEDDTVIRKLLDNSDTGYYRELLWILDNMYIAGETDKIEFLSNLGIKYDSSYGAYMYNPVEGYDYSKYVSGDTVYSGYAEENLITDADIKAVQRAAIWYYTNYMQDTTNYAIFNQTDSEVNWLTITSDGSLYTNLSDYEKLTGNGPQRVEQVQILYNYLIDAASKNKTQYNTTPKAPAEVDLSGLTSNAEGKYILKTTRVGSNYVVGPIVIKKNNNSTFGIKIEVTDPDNNNAEVAFTYTDNQGVALEITDAKELVGLQEGFYITIPRNTIERLNIKVTTTEDVRLKTLWLKGEEKIVDGKDIIQLDGEQPMVEVTNEEVPTPIEFVSSPEEFDLALRKYITGLNTTKITNRIPVISEATLENGTTATYNHKKDPVIVEDKDEVTYSITIYNEGNKDGYAKQIIDQLPTGLVNSPNNSLGDTPTVVSKDKNGNVKNTYTVSYNSTLNQITLDIVNTAENPAKSLTAYTAGNLDYETIEIKCIVAQEADTQKQIILTNVAWISMAYDSEKGVDITAVGQDRDSEPQTSPSVSKGTMENYKGHETNKNDLADSQYFYKGEQDDDDFEKLVLMPIEKIFDLELVKFIAAISDDAKIEDGEYLTDTKNAIGIYERAPKISIVKEQDSEDRRIHCDWNPSNKNPILVEAGDYVLYTIRVYNAGEIDGYAAEIKDHLPVGLELVETTDTNAEYYGIWKVERVADENGDEKQILSTKYLAKGQGKELEAEPGEELYTANLLKALNPDAAVADGENRNPDYRDVQVLCRVKDDAQKNGVLINYAQISKDTDKDGKEINDIDSTPDNLPKEGPHEDDEDLEKIKLQCFDLSLRKFITAVNNKELKENGKYTREPDVDVSDLVSGEDTTAEYKHPKTPVPVQVGDKIVYTIRVYNEGDINGFASEIKDYLPPYLEYLKDSEINAQYKWQVSEDRRIVTTKYLADKELTAFDGTKLDYEDVKIECRVLDTAPLKQNQTNIAEISEYTYNGKEEPKDIDSSSDNMEDKIPTDENLPAYKDDKINDEYVPGNEDDDDFEKVYVQEFDLALRKFITQIQDKEVTTRVPQVKVENGIISYTHPKDPITVHVDDVVIYTLRIYNEGEIDGYASEITDDIPEYLEYLPENSTNVEYMWKMYDKDGNETEKVEEAVKIKTTYLAKENGENNLLKAFDGQNPDYRDIKIAFKVKDPNSNQYIITNYAQISDDTDENGNEVKDKDSEPDEWKDGEDDQDIENVKVEYFDLALLKFVSKVIVIENGKETITETGYNGYEDPEPVVKVELHKKKLKDVVVKFGYGITIINQGDIAGYATEITDHIPEGLKFDAADNPEWTDEGNNVISTKQLEGKLLQPGETATIEVILTWINGADNLALKTNVAEISEDDNEYDVPDKDSTPDNLPEEGPHEDDEDLAKVILTITTGAAKTYFTLAIGLLTIVLVGIVLIKKFVI